MSTKAHESARLFFALPLPRHTRQRIAAIASEFKSTQSIRHCRPRWIPAANLHITLKFLGNQPLERVATLGEIAASLARSAPPIETQLEKVDAFPSMRESRTLVLRLKDPDRRIAALAEALDFSLAKLQLARETRMFKPHVTLARFRQSACLSNVEQPPITFGDGFNLDRIVLFSSELTPMGARYWSLRTAKLGTD